MTDQVSVEVAALGALSRWPQVVRQPAEPGPGGRFGGYGGRFVPETLMAALEELEAGYDSALADDQFATDFLRLLREYAGRPTPVTEASRLSEKLGAKILLKREDLTHTGAHKVNNVIGQGLLAARMGKPRIIAETGAGQHGVATATVAALLGLRCAVYMGSEDIRRQAPNVQRMRLLGADVRAVESGNRTLKEAMNEAIRDWVANVRDTYYCIGTVAGPHPYPRIVRDFQRVIGLEAAGQLKAGWGGPPAAVVACVGGGSNAIGAFYGFLDDTSVQLFGAEAAGHGLASGLHAATLTAGRPGVLHGAMSYLLQTPDGQVADVHSISAGLDYPGVGPEHSQLKDSGRVEYLAVTDDEAVAALLELTRLEGIVPALESSHALAALGTVIERVGRGSTILVCLSGRGDKDLATIERYLGEEEASGG